MSLFTTLVPCEIRKDLHVCLCVHMYKESYLYTKATRQGCFENERVKYVNR